MQMLMERFFKFQNAKYILKPPKAVVREADEYLKYSDDFYGWWSDKFVACKGNILPFKRVWQAFASSEYYNNMNKKEKRRYNQTQLKDTIAANMFLKDKFYKKGRMYEGCSITGDSICGYRLRGEEGVSDEEDGF